MEALHTNLTDGIIGAFYEVYNELGYGFLERVYQNALCLELEDRGFEVEPQKQIDVYYKGKKVGEYYADLVVNNLVILELKATEDIVEAFEAQVINYLRASRVEVGLLLNFGKRPQIKRKIYENSKKKVGKFEHS